MPATHHDSRTCNSGMVAANTVAAHSSRSGLAWLSILAASMAALTAAAATAAAVRLARRKRRCRRTPPVEAASDSHGDWFHLFLDPADASRAGGAAPPGHHTQQQRGQHEEDGLDRGGAELPAGFAGLAEGPDLPEAFQDPLSLGPLEDPVVLCGTGQVYNYSSPRAWLCTGQRTCPKTNLALVDVEVVRLPMLRHAVHAWMQHHSLPLPQPEATPQTLAAADTRFPGWVADLRCGDVARRGVGGAAKINDVLIHWGQDTEAGEQLKQHRAAAMEHVLDDLVWLLRHGDSYGQGVAAAALSQYTSDEHRQWLAAVAAVPAVLLLGSPNGYARHSAARLLAALARVHPHMPRMLCSVGAVPGLLAQLDLKQPFPYARCSAASALCAIAAAGEGGERETIRKGGGVGLLVGLVLQEEREDEAGQGEQHECLVRYDKRDAAAALLELGAGEEELRDWGVSLGQLHAYKQCSHAWLHGQVASPDEGYTQVELAQQRLEQADAESDGDGDDDDDDDEEEEEEEDGRE